MLHITEHEHKHIQEQQQTDVSWYGTD